MGVYARAGPKATGVGDVPLLVMVFWMHSVVFQWAANADHCRFCVEHRNTCTMKIHLAFPVLVIGALTACEEPDPRQSAPYKQLETEHEASVQSSAGKDSTINDLFGAFNRIGDNLRMIREKEGLLSAPRGGDMAATDNSEEWMLAEIRAIDSLLNENRSLIARMRRETKGNKKELGELQRTVDELEKSMTAKDGEITTLKDDYFIERKLYPNVDFYSGIIYRAIGIPTRMFTVMFALGRLPGWIAQWKEMVENKEPIGRPRQVYTGKIKRDYVAIKERK